ncbi:hypothetical protein QE411_002901 [Microbacterium arborescens]|nr:hypothetical protein [Microbacterium arborescens]
MAILRQSEGVWSANGYVMAPARALSALVVMTLTAMTVAGCAVDRPTVEEARAETEALLQQIANEVPGGVVTVDTPNPSYRECGDGTYYATIQWGVTPRPGFDGEAFVDALPGRLGEDFVVAETVDITSPAVALDHSGGTVLDVQVLEGDGGIVIDLLGLTPCGVGQPPAR